MKIINHVYSQSSKYMIALDYGEVDLKNDA